MQQVQVPSRHAGNKNDNAVYCKGLPDDKAALADTKQCRALRVKGNKGQGRFLPKGALPQVFTCLHVKTRFILDGGLSGM